MGVQKHILTKTGVDADGNPVGTVGILSIGKPGDIVARAFGPIELVIANAELKAAVTTASGTFEFGKPINVTVFGKTLKGIIVNPNDNVFVGSADAPLAQANVPCEGSQVGVMQFGTCVVKCADVAAIKQVVNGEAGYGYDQTIAAAEAYGADIADWESKTYAKDALVKHEGFVYEATAAIETQEAAFTPANWTKICPVDEIKGICEFTANGPKA